MLVFGHAKQFQIAPQFKGVLQITGSVLGEVLRTPKRITLPLKLYIAVQGNFNMFREGIIKEHLVSLPDGPVAITGIVYRDIKNKLTCLIVNCHYFTYKKSVRF